ncbi:hypothetical protein N802_14850 [Knoellia sinensis KCTC 19936]|uniref:PknH-like extracellular domain-containing protein n=1 Tax=Knoellia sinensis KCTC 19936 TaxID=1385520 RepID=A0A0A0J8C1_9MICO|nr:hypothetical protein [Knoellia sinensis]KGN33408.1 hypothetical protein N802_14850 [Knoellia sinensis KCTC 19936]
MFTRTTRLAAVVGSAVLFGLAGTTGASAAGPGIPDVLPDTMLGASLQAEFDNHPNGPTVTGAQYCDPINNPKAKLAQVRQNWMYWNADDDTSGLSSDVTISKYARAGVAFAQVVTDTGYCTMGESLERTEWDGVDAGTHALYSGADYAAAVIHDGRYIIAVAVSDWDGGLDEVGGATAEALKLAAAL